MKKILFLFLLMHGPAVVAAEGFAKEIRLVRADNKEAEKGSTGMDFVEIGLEDPITLYSIGDLLDDNYKNHMPTVLAQIVAEPDDQIGKTFYNYMSMVDANKYVYGDGFFGNMRGYSRYFTREWHDFTPWGGREGIKGPKELFDIQKRRIKSKIRYYVAYGTSADVQKFVWIGDDEILTEVGPRTDKPFYWYQYAATLRYLFDAMVASQNFDRTSKNLTSIMLLYNIGALFANKANEKPEQALEYYDHARNLMIAVDLPSTLKLEFLETPQGERIDRFNQIILFIEEINKRYDTYKDSVKDRLAREQKKQAQEPPQVPAPKQPAPKPSGPRLPVVTEKPALRPVQPKPTQPTPAQPQPARPQPTPGPGQPTRPAQPSISSAWLPADSAAKDAWTRIVALFRKHKDKRDFVAWAEAAKVDFDETTQQQTNAPEPLKTFLTPFWYQWEKLPAVGSARPNFINALDKIAPQLFGSSTIDQAKMKELQGILNTQFSDVQLRQQAEKALSRRLIP